MVCCHLYALLKNVKREDASMYLPSLELLLGIVLGIEFYLFVSHGGMNDGGFTFKFRNARSAFRNLHVDPLSFIPP